MSNASEAIFTTDIADNIEQDVERSYSTFSVRLVRNSRSKRRLSNRLTVSVPDGRTESTVHFTLREARALQKFLNDNIESFSETTVDGRSNVISL
jgi:hypothetical protein